MREHLLQYIETNYDAIMHKISDILSERKLKFTEYITMMQTKATCGYEIMLKILTLMFKFKVVVIRSDFIWVSEDVEPVNCEIVLVQKIDGTFYGTKCDKKFDVGAVPNFQLPGKKPKGKRSKQLSVESSVNTDDSIEIVPTIDIKSAKKVSVQSENTDDSSNIIEMNKNNQEKMSEEIADKSTPTRSRRGKRRVCNEMQNVDVGTTSTPKNRGRALKDFNTTLSPIEERRGSDVENKMPPEKNMIKQLGVKGPATKVTIAMHDLSPKLQGHSSVTIKKIDDTVVIVRLRCSYCKTIFYMQTAYETHLLMDHKFRNFRLHPPEIVEQHEITCSSISPLLSSDDTHNKTVDKDGSIGKSQSIQTRRMVHYQKSNHPRSM